MKFDRPMQTEMPVMTLVKAKIGSRFSIWRPFILQNRKPELDIAQPRIEIFSQNLMYIKNTLTKVIFLNCLRDFECMFKICLRYFKVIQSYTGSNKKKENIQL